MNSYTRGLKPPGKPEDQPESRAASAYPSTAGRISTASPPASSPGTETEPFVPLLDLYRKNFPRAIELQDGVGQLQHESQALGENKANEVHVLRNQISDLEEQLTASRQNEQDYRQRSQEQADGLEQQIPRLRHQIAALEEKERTLPELYRRIEALESQIATLREREKTIHPLQEQIARLKEVEREATRDIPLLRLELEKQAGFRSEADTQAEQLRQALAAAALEIADLRKTNQHLQECEQTHQQGLLQQELSAHQVEVQRLRRQLETSTRAHQRSKERARAMADSTSWRITKPFRWIRDRLGRQSTRSPLRIEPTTARLSRHRESSR